MINVRILLKIFQTIQTHKDSNTKDFSVSKDRESLKTFEPLKIFRLSYLNTWAFKVFRNKTIQSVYKMDITNFSDFWHIFQVIVMSREVIARSHRVNKRLNLLDVKFKIVACAWLRSN